MVDGLHGEVEGHELNDWPQLLVCCARSKAGEASFGDGRVDDARAAKFFQQPLGDLVGALVLRDLLADDKDIGLAVHLLEQRRVECLANGHLQPAGAR